MTLFLCFVVSEESSFIIPWLKADDSPRYIEPSFSSTNAIEACIFLLTSQIHMDF